MAFLYKRFKRGNAGRKALASPFWHIEHRDPARVRLSPTGRVIPVREATTYRIANVAESAKARILEAEMVLRELSAITPRDRSAWKFWVTPFIHKISAGRSRERYLTAWRMLELWLIEGKINFPSQVTYNFCETYINWRETPDPANRKFAVRRSTANYEFRFFRRLMKNAMREGFCSGNIAREVELKRRKDQPRILKPDLNDSQLQDIWRALDAEPEPRRTCFRRAFAIALLHGIRLNETNPNPQTDLRLDAGEPPGASGGQRHLAAIRFFQKGGRERWKPIHPQLIPFFKQLRADGKTNTFALDRDEHGELRWNTAWHNFFTHKPAGNIHFKRRPGLAHIGFHSLRVTVENVLREAGIAKEVREMYLTHEHETHDDINAAYDRVKLREMVVCHAPLTRSWLDVN